MALNYIYTLDAFMTIAPNLISELLFSQYWSTSFCSCPSLLSSLSFYKASKSTSMFYSSICDIFKFYVYFLIFYKDYEIRLLYKKLDKIILIFLIIK